MGHCSLQGPQQQEVDYEAASRTNTTPLIVIVITFVYYIFTWGEPCSYFINLEK